MSEILTTVDLTNEQPPITISCVVQIALIAALLGSFIGACKVLASTRYNEYHQDDDDDRAYDRVANEEEGIELQQLNGNNDFPNRRSPTARYLLNISWNKLIPLLALFAYSCYEYNHLFSGQYSKVVLENGLKKDCSVTKALCGSKKVAAYYTEPNSSGNLPTGSAALFDISKLCKDISIYQEDHTFKLDMTGSLEAKQWRENSIGIDFDGSEASVITGDQRLVPFLKAEHKLTYAGTAYFKLEKNEDKHAGELKKHDNTHLRSLRKNVTSAFFKDHHDSKTPNAKTPVLN
ncbi:MAG: hypothetical protein V4496_05965 [Pseudomonadota bacterium]